MALFRCGNAGLKYSKMNVALNTNVYTVDVSDCPDYANLTVSDFIVEFTQFMAGGSTVVQQSDMTVGATSYDNTTGTLTITSGINVSGQYAAFCNKCNIYVK